MHPHTGPSTFWLKTHWTKTGYGEKLGLVWRNWKKISQIINDYVHLPFFLSFILCFTQNLISSSTDPVLLGGESADWGLCAGSEPAPEAASSRAGERAAEAGGENRFRGPGGRDLGQFRRLPGGRSQQRHSSVLGWAARGVERGFSLIIKYCRENGKVHFLKITLKKCWKFKKSFVFFSNLLAKFYKGECSKKRPFFIAPGKHNCCIR